MKPSELERRRARIVRVESHRPDRGIDVAYARNDNRREDASDVIAEDKR